MKMIRAIKLVVVCMFLSTPSQAALIVQGGIVTGASGIDVNGVLLDVVFVDIDGTCAAVFNGCDEDSDFFFTSATRFDARDALRALEDLFPESPNQISPNLINGCGDSGGATECKIITPYDFFLQFGTQARYASEHARIFSSGPGDAFEGSTVWPTYDRDADNNYGATFAIWSVASVPEPTFLWSAVTIFFGMLGYQRRRRERV